MNIALACVAVPTYSEPSRESSWVQILEGRPGAARELVTALKIPIPRTPQVAREWSPCCARIRPTGSRTLATTVSSITGTTLTHHRLTGASITDQDSIGCTTNRPYRENRQLLGWSIGSYLVFCVGVGLSDGSSVTLETSSRHG